MKENVAKLLRRLREEQRAIRRFRDTAIAHSVEAALTNNWRLDREAVRDIEYADRCLADVEQRRRAARSLA